MVRAFGAGGGGTWNYVQDTDPADAEEGETLYRTDTNEAKVYDGSAWHGLSITDHGELGNVTAGDHRSDSNIVTTVDGSSVSDFTTTNSLTDPSGKTHSGELAESQNTFSPTYTDSGQVTFNSGDTNVNVTSVPSGTNYLFAHGHTGGGDSTLSGITFDPDGASYENVIAGGQAFVFNGGVDKITISDNDSTGNTVDWFVFAP